ncbi:hypothetical protein F0562_030614 [Nyssa sinensis]|uniref:GH18 domain-containing protein n=1 Tax=Nyssa sinensis TaxID=561372 RepID=A0A5J5B381_9ASTE|nr:hypothetical protein F0562_030614 [Nyssa sinensis]
MALNIFILLFLIILHSELPCSNAQTWINVGYWLSDSGLSIEDINSPLFTHLVCSFAGINSSTYQLSLPSDEQLFSTFNAIVKQKNPSIITLLSIGGGNANYTAFSSMVPSSKNGEPRQILKGFRLAKLVLGLPFYGYAWTLDNPEDNVVGSPANGSAINAANGAMAYKAVKEYMKSNGVISMYNATYVVNYCTFESTWIGFDDVEAVTTKVSYAKEMKMLGYHIWQISQDDNWVLSQSAQDVKDRGTGKNRQLLIIVLLPIAIVGLLLGSLICYLKRRRRLIKSEGKMNED